MKKLIEGHRCLIYFHFIHSFSLSTFLYYRSMTGAQCLRVLVRVCVRVCMTENENNNKMRTKNSFVLCAVSSVNEVHISVFVIELYMELVFHVACA